MQPINWDALGAIGEIVGALGVIVTLVYLSLQIRQNTKVTRASTAQQMTNNWVLVNLEMSRNTAVNLNITPETTPEELQLVLSFWRAMFHQFSNSYYQREHGALDELLFEPTTQELTTYAKDETVGPNLRAAWALINFIYNKDFRKYVDDLLAANPIQTAQLFAVDKVVKSYSAVPAGDADTADEVSPDSLEQN